MQTAPINWRPLGELFVDAGLISADELERALAEQAETSQRLGEILVTRGLVSTNDLTEALVDQLGRELERERPGGFTVRSLDERRDEADTEEDAEPTAPAEPREAPTELEPEARRSMSEPPSAAPSPVAVAPAPAPAPANDDDPRLLLRQVDELRSRMAEEFGAREAALIESLKALESRLAATESSLEEERTAHRLTREELERGRQEAGRQAAELRKSLAGIRSEVANIDAGMAWFELWANSASASPDAAPNEPSPQS